VIVARQTVFAAEIGADPPPRKIQAKAKFETGAAPAPNGRGAKPKREWRQTQIHANFLQ
jgi:hypothetical protein